MKGAPRPLTYAGREVEVARLRKESRGNAYLRCSAAAVVALVVASWLFGGFNPRHSITPRRLTNLARFLEEVRPEPVRAGHTADTLRWAGDLMKSRGLKASVQTLALSVAAIVLAGAAGLVLALPAARNVATPEPFAAAAGTAPSGRRLAWRLIVIATRLSFTFARAIPEYVWAFLLLAILGHQAWPAVLALALHNAGILGRLGAEVIENVDPAAPRALRDLGGSRAQVATAGLLPLVLPRFLLYFFYRWETCVREATVLGLLGFTSLGYWIADARARDRYDEMLVFILLGAALVVIGDVVSALTRSFVRRAG